MRLAFFLGACTAIFGLASPAEAWDPFLRPNPNVEAGNQAMSTEDYAGALQAYDRAAAELPDAPGVQLNRGLALLAQNELEPAREALLRAVDPEADASIRADAYYNLGLAFYRQGDAAATEEDHESSQRWFREAIDAYERSLRARPGDRDTAWNLEVALRRLREEEEAQQRQEQQEQEQQEQEQQDQEEQEQQDQEEQEQQEQDESQGNEPQEQEQEQDDTGANSDQGNSEPQEEEQGNQEPEPPNDEGNSEQSPNEPREDPNQGEQPEEADRRDDPLPADVARALDNLQDSEESFQRQRARMRARREGRRPTKDW